MTLFVEQLRCFTMMVARALQFIHVSSFVFYSVLFVSYKHIHVPFITYCSRLFVVVFRIFYILLNMMLFVGSQSYISPPSFMFVSAVVSEIHELNQNKKKNSEIGYSQFNTFPGRTIYSFLTRGTI